MYNCKSRYVSEIYKCCLRLDYYKEKKKQTKNKQKQKQNKTKAKKKKEKERITIALSLGPPSFYFYNKRCNMLL